MDQKFLEFWANLLLSAARGQHQADTVSRWMGQGMKGVQDLNEVFRQFYGLGSADTPDSGPWKSARKAFKENYQRYLDAMGMVPVEKYQDLTKKVAALEEKVSAQKAIIGKLRTELSAAHLSKGDNLRGFQELIQVQSEQFQELSHVMNRFFRSPSEDPQEE